MYRGGNPLMHLYKLLYNTSVGALTQKKAGLFGSADDFAAYFGGSRRPEGDIEVMVHVIPLKDADGNVIYEDVPMDRVMTIIGRE